MHEHEIDDEDRDPKSIDKWRVAIILGIIFVIMTAPIIFGFSNSIFRHAGLPTCDGKGRPTMFGWILHAVVFVLIVRLLMH